jgi:hypothetical protein
MIDMQSLREEIKQLVKYWVFPLLRPRRFHAYGIGIAKSGTSSMNGILGRYRSVHEPAKERFMAIIMSKANGSLSATEAHKQITRLNRRLWLEYSSSWLNGFMLDSLLQYPDARFILTIRDCYSWLDSVINHILIRMRGSSPQATFFRWYGGCFQAAHRKPEQVLVEHGLYPLETWLRAWAHHNATALSKVPGHRLLVVRTQDIPRDLERIASFLDVPAHTLASSKAHLYKAEAKFGLLRQIDSGFLHDQVQEHCGQLMERYFPDVRGLPDVVGQDAGQHRRGAPSPAEAFWKSS